VQGPVPVRPQLRTLADGGRPAAPPRWRPLRGDECRTEATRVRPLAIRAMEEIGINISEQESKTLGRYLQEPFDYVITVCDDANEACPFFPGASTRLH
jgi:hypothetical protein